MNVEMVETIFDQINKHNDAVNRSGFYALCRRIGGNFESEAASRSR
jgi:hypothetical protein